MSIRRLKSWLLAWGLSCLPAAPAVAQVPPFFRGFADDVQIFSQPDLNSFFSREIETDGWFGGIETFLLSASGPAKVEIGVNGGVRQVYVNNSAPGTFGTDGTTPANLAAPPALAAPVNNFTNGALFAGQRNSNDTGWIRAALSGGGRFDFGFVEDGHGWLISAFNPISNVQEFTAYDAGVVFNEPTVRVYGAFAGATAVPNGVSANNPNFIDLPILYGFVDRIGGITGAGTRQWTPDGFADDLNGNNLYGPDGRDRGTTNAQGVPQAGQPLDGRPDSEGNADVIAPAPQPGAPVNNANAVVTTREPIDYGDAVPLPVIFTELYMRQRTTSGSIEANYLRRIDRYTPRGLTIDMLGGVRFLDLSDQFTVRGTGGILADSYWDTRAANRLVGPQLGVRVIRRRNRWSWTAEGRGVAAADFQTVRQDGEIGSLLTQVPTVTVNATNVGGIAAGAQAQNAANASSGRESGVATRRLNQPLNLNPTAFNSSANMVTFSPVAEVRVSLSYQLFSSVFLNGGYTAIYADNLARSANMVDYTLPRMGILSANNRQPIFLSGINLGIQINR